MAIAERLDGARVLAITSRSPATEVVAFAELLAVPGVPCLSEEEARALLTTHDPPDAELRARLGYAAWALSGRPSDAARVLGLRNLRLDRLARDDDAVITWTWNDHCVTLTPFSHDGRLGPDLQRYAATVSLLCPEADEITLQLCTPRGTALAAVPDDKRLDSPRVDGPVQRARSWAFERALDRIRAADSVSERLDRQHEVTSALATVLDEGRVRLLAHGADTLARQRWSAAVRDIQERVGALPLLPVAREPGRDDTRDAVAERLVRVAVALSHVADAIGGESVDLREVAALLREQLEPLEKTRGPLMPQLARDSERLAAPAARLADALLAKANEPALAARDPSELDRAVARALQRARKRERTALRHALRGLKAQLHAVGGDGAQDVPGLQWLVVVPLDKRDQAIWDHLGAMKSDTRGRLAFRITVAPADTGWILAGLAWQIGREGSYPADTERVDQLARRAALPVLDSEQLASDEALADEIIEASRLAAWIACRRKGRFSADRLMARLEDQIALYEAHAQAVAARIPPAATIPVLTQYIRREAAGDTPVSLISGEVLLRRYGDANFATIVTSVLRVGAAALAARALGSP